MENFSLHVVSPKLGVCYSHKGVGDQLRREEQVWGEKVGGIDATHFFLHLSFGGYFTPKAMAGCLSR